MDTTTVESTVGTNSPAPSLMQTASDTLKEACAKLIEESVKTFDGAKDFLKEQIPDILKQLIEWTIVKDIFIFIGCLAIVVVSALVVYFTWKKIPSFFNNVDDNNPLPLFACIAAVIMIPVFGGIGFHFAMDGLEAYIAPKVWLLEYAYHLLDAAHTKLTTQPH